MAKDLAKDVNAFFREKRELVIALQQQKEGIPLAPQKVEDLLTMEERWKNHRPFAHSIRPEIEELKSLRTMPRKEPAQDDPSASEPSEPTASKRLPENLGQNTESEIVTPHNLLPPETKLIHNFFEAAGIVGEETNRELLIYGVLSKTNIGIESIAGSGKSALLNALISALPPSSYHILHQGTAASLYNNSHIGSAEILIIPELQKIFTPSVEEIIKNLTEGASITYTRTNSRRDGVDQFEIKRKTILYSFAISNKHLKDRDDEFYRRFIILHTGISREQNNRVVLTYAQNDFLGEEENTVQQKLQPLQQHVAAIFQQPRVVRNPFLESVVNTLPLEITGHIRFRSAVKYLQAMIKGCTVFHAPPGSGSLFSTYRDSQHILSLYQQTLCHNLHGINVLDAAMLDLITLEPLSYSDLRKKFSDIYAVPCPKKSALDSLVSKGIVEQQGNGYSHSTTLEIHLDPEQSLARADVLMKSRYPKHREQWYNESVQQIEKIA